MKFRVSANAACAGGKPCGPGTTIFAATANEDVDVKGSMVEVYAGLEYRLFKHFALGAAYDYLDVHADYQKGKKGGWGVENTWSSVFAYAALYF